MAGSVWLKFSKNVDIYLSDLVDILIENHYFSYIESAKEYVSKIYEYCETHLPSAHILGITKKLTGELLNIYGGQCHIFTYKMNKTTTWCIIYTVKNNVYLICRIFNNHIKHYMDIEY